MVQKSVQDKQQLQHEGAHNTGVHSINIGLKFYNCSKSDKIYQLTFNKM